MNLPQCEILYTPKIPDCEFLFAAGGRVPSQNFLKPSRRAERFLLSIRELKFAAPVMFRNCKRGGNFELAAMCNFIYAENS